MENQFFLKLSFPLFVQQDLVLPMITLMMSKAVCVCWLVLFSFNRDVIFHKTSISSATNLESISSFVEIHKGEFSERIKI